MEECWVVCGTLNTWRQDNRLSLPCTLVLPPPHCMPYTLPHPLPHPQVQPLAASLHSSHTFIAYTVEELYVWSGQFSPPHERRGALVVVRMLDPDFL